MKACALSHISKAANSLDPISQDEKDHLWDEGVLGEDEPDVLRDTIMYLVGFSFVLRGEGAMHVEMSWFRSPDTGQEK